MASDLLQRLIGLNLAASAAILLLLLAGPALRRQFGARVAYAAWAIVPLAALATLLPARQAETLLIEPAPVAPIAQATVHMITLAPHAQASPFDWTTAVLVTWGVCAFGLLALTLWTQARAIGLLGRLTPEDGEILRSSNPAVGPAVIGVLRPRIVLPADFERRFDARERAVILAHEQAHVAAGDARTNAAIALARCAFWFNPFVHLAARRIRLDQELACDEAVIARHPRERRVYGEALLKSQVAPAPLPFGCYWPSRSAQRLKARILMLTVKGPGQARRRVGAALVVLIAAGVGYASWAAAPPAPQSTEGFVPVERPRPAPVRRSAAAPSPAAPAARRVAASPAARAAAEQARADARFVPTVIARAPGGPPPVPPPPGPPPLPPGKGRPAPVQLLTRGSELVMFSCQPTTDPGRVVCDAVPSPGGDKTAAAQYQRASQLYRAALVRGPGAQPPLRVSCYWPSKALVRQPWTKTPDYRCLDTTHLSVTAALSRKVSAGARLLSYTCRPAENTGLRSCSASILTATDTPTPRRETLALTIGGVPIAQASDTRTFEIAPF